MGKEIDKAKKVFKDAFDVLNDYFEEKRSDTVMEEEKKAKKGKVALAKFSKGLIGNTDKINFRILIGNKKEIGDFIYEAIYLSDKKEPKIYYHLPQSILVNLLLFCHIDMLSSHFHPLREEYQYFSILSCFEPLYFLRNQMLYLVQISILLPLCTLSQNLQQK